jgi:hypothetical protein
MAREIPEVVRAAAGLAATVLDEARKLPETLPGLPVRIIGLAMQQAMKVQQQYAGLVARGDELFTGRRGENEPGLATFDDDEPVTPTPAPGFRDSAFDRVSPGAPDTATAYEVTDAQEADQVEEAQTSLDELAVEAPATNEILDELAVEEMVDEPLAGAPDAQAPVMDAPVTEDAAAVETALVESDRAPEPTPEPAPEATPSAADTLDAEPTADVATTAEVITADSESPTPTDEAEGGTERPSSQAPLTAPVDGYDSFSIAQLRGRLRGYQAVTVRELLAYEEATRAREPYLRMLRNRLEKLEEQEIEASPLAPRGA